MNTLNKHSLKEKEKEKEKQDGRCSVVDKGVTGSYE